MLAGRQRLHYVSSSLFPMYFDHNATSPLLPAARQAWLDASDRFVGNPSSQHRIGARAEMALDAAREALAASLDCGPLEIIWTSGATESSNMVLYNLVRSLGSDVEIWISVTEHPCVLSGARHYFPGRHRLIPARQSGIVDLDWMEANLRPSRPGAVAVMAANNETGVLQPWREVLSLCRQREVPLFCDGAQWMGKEIAHGLGACEYVSGCAHKFGGPRGVGFLKVPRRGRFYPLVLGGGQEAGRRAGTENVPGVVSMIAALEDRERLLAGHPMSEKVRLREEFETKLTGGETRQAWLCRFHGFGLRERDRGTFARFAGNGVCAGWGGPRIALQQQLGDDSGRLGCSLRGGQAGPRRRAKLISSGEIPWRKTQPSERWNEKDTPPSWDFRCLPRAPGFLELDPRRTTPVREIRLAEIIGGHREEIAGDRHAMIPGIIVLVYLAVVLSIGIFASRRGKRSGEDYFVANRSLSQYVFLLALFGTNMTAFAILGSSGHACFG